SQPSPIQPSHKSDTSKPAPPVTTARMHPPLEMRLTVYPEPFQLTTAASRDSMREFPHGRLPKFTRSHAPGPPLDHFRRLVKPPRFGSCRVFWRRAMSRIGGLLR